jgi:ABC-2 type transport system ATP-binding protein
MTARENLYFAAKFFFSGPHSRIVERCDEMLELVGLTDKANRAIRGFSGGEKQRLGIALAQVNYPDLLILDEPASSLDPLGRRKVLDVMDRLRKHTTIFYSTHILDDVQRVSDMVAILNHGRLEACGSIEQILNGKGGVVYTISTKGSPENLEARLSTFHWITHSSVTQHNGSSIWQVSVIDEKIAERQLLRIFLEEELLVVTEFSRKKFDLEEAFIDIVKGDGNGK